MAMIVIGYVLNSNAMKLKPGLRHNKLPFPNILHAIICLSINVYYKHTSYLENLIWIGTTTVL